MDMVVIASGVISVIEAVGGGSGGGMRSLLLRNSHFRQAIKKELNIP